jgi:hypothetical protein
LQVPKATAANPTQCPDLLPSRAHPLDPFLSQQE